MALPLLLVIVTVWVALVVPSSCFPKFNDEAERVNGGGAPVPLSAAVCGLLVAVSATVNTPLITPVEVGENVTLILQDPPAATLSPTAHVLAVSMLKSPPAETLEIVIAELWPLVSFTVRVVLVPTVSLPKDTLPGFKATDPFGPFWLSPEPAPEQRRTERNNILE
jgi:hypothetical protein